MKRIAIIDTRHFELSYTIISLFEKAGFRITVFIHLEGYQELNYLLGEKTARVDWVIRDSGESNRDFIRRTFVHLKQEDFHVIYFCTIENNYIHYAWSLKKLKKDKVVLTLHDINGYFIYHPSLSIKRAVRFAGRRALLKMISRFAVLSEGLAANLGSRLSSSKKIYRIPGAFFEDQGIKLSQFQRGETIRITVPGSIDTRRRNYRDVFSLLNATAALDLKISIVLLGGFSEPHGDVIKRMATKDFAKDSRLVIYETPSVPQAEFDRVLNDTHFIWTPLQPQVIIHDGVIERYGETICSGNMGDIIRHAKPSIAPAFLTMDKSLRPACFQYNELQEITAMLLALDERKYALMQQSALNASSAYNPEMIIEANPDLFG